MLSFLCHAFSIPSLPVVSLSGSADASSAADASGIPPASTPTRAQSIPLTRSLSLSRPTLATTPPRPAHKKGRSRADSLGGPLHQRRTSLIVTDDMSAGEAEVEEGSSLLRLFNSLFFLHSFPAAYVTSFYLAFCLSPFLFEPDIVIPLFSFFSSIRGRLFLSGSERLVLECSATLLSTYCPSSLLSHLSRADSYSPAISSTLPLQMILSSSNTPAFSSPSLSLAPLSFISVINQRLFSICRTGQRPETFLFLAYCPRFCLFCCFHSYFDILIFAFFCVMIDSACISFSSGSRFDFHTLPSLPVPPRSLSAQIHPSMNQALVMTLCCTRRTQSLTLTIMPLITCQMHCCLHSTPMLTLRSRCVAESGTVRLNTTNQHSAA